MTAPVAHARAVSRGYAEPSGRNASCPVLAGLFAGPPALHSAGCVQPGHTDAVQGSGHYRSVGCEQQM